MDCAEGRDEIPGMYVREFTDGKEEIESLQERITGRFSCETIKDKDGNVLVKANHMIVELKRSQDRERRCQCRRQTLRQDQDPYDSEL